MAKKKKADVNRSGGVGGTSTSDDERIGPIPAVGAAQSDRLKGRAELIKAVTGLPQLTGLIVLVVESILLAVLYKSDPSDPMRIWYIIVALLCFVLLLVVLVVDRYLLREKVATRDAVREAAVDQALDSLGKQLSVRYGLSAELTSIRVEITDLAGNTRITRSWKGLSVGSEFQIPYLPGKIWADNPGRITSPAKLLEYKLAASKKVHIDDIKTEPNGNYASFKVEIVGGLYAADGPLDYAYESEVTHMFHMSEAETKEAYKDNSFPFEYMAITLDVVVNRLELEIVFPDGFHVTPLPAVFYGLSEIVHNSELARVEFGFNNRRASCSINEPLLGLSYLIYWMPPPRAESSPVAPVVPVTPDGSTQNNTTQNIG